MPVLVMSAGAAPPKVWTVAVPVGSVMVQVTVVGSVGVPETLKVLARVANSAAAA